MNKEYLQLCAEMAYNETVFESYLESESLLEADNKTSFKEKVMKFFETIKTFIKKIFNKVIEFLQNAVQKVKNKLSSKKESKQESVNLYDRLMEMVLTEDSNYGADIIKFYTDSKNTIDSDVSQMTSIYTKNCEKLDKLSVQYQKDIEKAPKEKVNWARNILRAKSKEVIDDFKLLESVTSRIANIKSSASKIGKDFEQNEHISSNIINILIDSINHTKKELSFQIKCIEDNEKAFERIYRMSWDNDESGEDDSAYGVQTYASSVRELSSEFIKCLSKAESCYIEITSVLLRYV